MFYFLYLRTVSLDRFPPSIGVENCLTNPGLDSDIDISETCVQTGDTEMEFKEFEPRFKSAKIRQNPV